MIKRGFSLMEMMVVMLIVAVIAAATAPMINKKMIENASGDSPWIWTSPTNNSIAYNIRGIKDAQAVIGAIKPLSDVESRLHIESKDDIPQITLGNKNDSFNTNNILGIYYKSGNIVSSNSDPSGCSLGISSYSPADRSVALGAGANASGTASVAIGDNAKANNMLSIAIGSSGPVTNNTYVTKTDGDFSIAIGGTAQTGGKNSISIGYGVKTTGENTVVIGKSPNYVTPYFEKESVAISAKEAQEGSIAIGFDSLTGSTVTGVIAGKKSIAIGHKSQAESDNTIAIGDQAYAKGDGSIAIGTYDKDNSYWNNTNTNAKSSIAIGNAAKVYQDSTSGIAIGKGAFLSEGSSNSIAIGKDRFVEGESSVAILGSSMGNYNVSLGHNAQTGHSNYYKYGSRKSIAIGFNACAETNVAGGNVDSAIAIGDQAKAYHNRSVAIGAGAMTKADNQIVLGDEFTTVYIPGHLAVAKSSIIGINEQPFIRVWKQGGGTSYLMHLDEGSNDLRPGTYWNTGTFDWDDTFTSSSDRRLKDVGEVFKAGLEEVKKLEVFNYTFKKDPNKTPRVGVMAQDLEKIFPKAVFKGDDGFLRIRMEDMFYAVVNAIKELDSKLTAVVEDVKTAVADIADLKVKSAEYEKTIAELVEQNKAQEKALKDLEKRLAKLEKKAKKSSELDVEEE